MLQTFTTLLFHTFDSSSKQVCLVIPESWLIKGGLRGFNFKNIDSLFSLLLIHSPHEIWLNLSNTVTLKNAFKSRRCYILKFIRDLLYLYKSVAARSFTLADLCRGNGIWIHPSHFINSRLSAVTSSFSSSWGGYRWVHIWQRSTHEERSAKKYTIKILYRSGLVKRLHELCKIYVKGLAVSNCLCTCKVSRNLIILCNVCIFACLLCVTQIIRANTHCCSMFMRQRDFLTRHTSTQKEMKGWTCRMQIIHHLLYQCLLILVNMMIILTLNSFLGRYWCY